MKVQGMDNPLAIIAALRRVWHDAISIAKGYQVPLPRFTLKHVGGNNVLVIEVSDESPSWHATVHKVKDEYGAVKGLCVYFLLAMNSFRCFAYRQGGIFPLINNDTDIAHAIEETGDEQFLKLLADAAIECKQRLQRWRSGIIRTVRRWLKENESILMEFEAEVAVDMLSR